MTDESTTPAAPSSGRPASPYLATVEHAGVVYLNGQLPYADGELAFAGTVGAEVTLGQAQASAQLAARLVVDRLAAQTGLDRVERILRLTVYVASAPGFTQQPAVADAASAVFVEVFGERGRHARSAVGVAALPKGAPVEVEATVAVSPRPAQ